MFQNFKQFLPLIVILKVSNVKLKGELVVEKFDLMGISLFCVVVYFALTMTCVYAHHINSPITDELICFTSIMTVFYAIPNTICKIILLFTKD